MNPRVFVRPWPRKATGPIARSPRALQPARSTVPNDMRNLPCLTFEPTLDYVVVKVPALHFREVPGRRPTLTTSMKARGQAAAIGPL